MAGRSDWRQPRHGLPVRGTEFVVPGQETETGKFGRLLPSLDPLRVEDAGLVELAAKMLESVGGTDDNLSIPAAFTFFGQFVDHNITFDATTIEEARIDPSSVVNYRTPRLDLDSVYGSGPAVQPHLYQRDDPDLFEIGCAQRFRPDPNQMAPFEGLQADLPRARNRFALIADPRNDENLIVAQLHLAFLFFHNNIVKWLRADSSRRQAPLRKTVFVEARDLAIRHYQWVVLHDFLPRLVNRDLLSELMGRKCLMTRKDQLFMPVEFSAAAYRFGHSALRPAYNVSNSFPGATLEQLFTLSGRPGGLADVPVSEAWIVEWYRLLNLGSTSQETDKTLSRRIDPYLADDLARLPLPGGATQSLPEMNLKRGNMLGLPAGQSVAGYFGCEVLTSGQLASGPDGEVAKSHDFDRDTPLWYYILKEALIMEGGVRLGPVGARIAGETFIGMLQLDANSILNRARTWTPVLPCRNKGEFTLADLLRFAGAMAPEGPGLGPSLTEACGYPVMVSCYSPVTKSGG